MLPVICALVLAHQTPASQSAGAADLYKQILPSVMNLTVQRADGSYMGTAFLIDRKGVAATAWHVVANAKSAMAKFSDGEEFEVSGVIDKDEKRDVALIRVKVAGRPPLELSASEPQVGSKAYVIGSPEGLDFSISEGLISQLRTIDSRRVVQFSCPASPGNSGGPLVDVDGKVLGVVSFGMMMGQNLNFAVPSAFVAGLDDSLPTQPWSNVKATPTTADGTKRFEYSKYGVPTWDGTRQDKHGNYYNWWKATLLYREGQPVSADNAALGLIAYFEGSSAKTDARAIPLQEAVLLEKYIREFRDTGAVKELGEKQEFSLQGVRFVESGIVFSDNPLRVEFVKRGGSVMSRPRWQISFYFGYGMNCQLDQKDVGTFLDSLDLWKRMLKDAGLDVETLTGS